jgi:TATA-box binding protein (TBP) (component of TFIID and TFIIIB)
MAPPSSENSTVQTISALIFRNGKVVLCGAHSERCAHRAVRMVLRRVQFSLNRGAKISQYVNAHRFPGCRVNNFRIHNIVGSLSLGHRINILWLHEDVAFHHRHTSHFTRCLYSPSQFPAARLKYRSAASATASSFTKELSISIFSSGKIIITGGRTTEQILECANFIQQFIVPYLFNKYVS